VVFYSLNHSVFADQPIASAALLTGYGNIRISSSFGGLAAWEIRRSVSGVCAVRFTCNVKQLLGSPCSDSWLGLNWPICILHDHLISHHLGELPCSNTVRSESRCALRLCCQYRLCRWSVLLFHCIELLNSGWSAIPKKCVVVWFSFYSLWFVKNATSLDTTCPSTIFYWLLLNWASLRRH
jgi:hypothetical protein